MQERLVEVDTLPQITKKVRDGKSSGLIEQLASRASTCIVGILGLLPGEPAE